MEFIEKDEVIKELNKIESAFGISMTHFSSMYNIAPSIVSKMIKGDTVPRQSTLQKIANAIKTFKSEPTVSETKGEKELIRFGDAVKAFRTKEGLTQRELAELVEWNLFAINRIELYKMATVFNQSKFKDLAELVGYKKERTLLTVLNDALNKQEDDETWEDVLKKRRKENDKMFERVRVDFSKAKLIINPSRSTIKKFKSVIKTLELSNSFVCSAFDITEDNLNDFMTDVNNRVISEKLIVRLNDAFDNDDEMLKKVIGLQDPNLLNLLLKTPSDVKFELTLKCLFGKIKMICGDDISNSEVRARCIKEVKDTYNLSNKDLAIVFETSVVDIKNMESRKIPVGANIFKGCKYLLSIVSENNHEELAKIYRWIAIKELGVLGDYLSDL